MSEQPIVCAFTVPELEQLLGRRRVDPALTGRLERLVDATSARRPELRPVAGAAARRPRLRLVEKEA